MLHLQILGQHYPSVTAALVQVATLNAQLALPSPSVHIVSDVHGEYAKLRQVINNASGSLRPMVDRLFPALDDAARAALLKHLYYPREAWLAGGASDQGARMLWFAEHALVLVRELARRSTIEHVDKIIPDPFDPMVREMIFGDTLARPTDYLARLVAPFVARDRALELVRMLARLVRNLAVGELIVAGDLGDRGPRIDKVIEVIMQQPAVAITWGNHDANWMAACLGHRAAIATVVRLSIRYQRRAQLEEGYGISLAPLEQLATTVYADDPCERFHCYGEAGPDAHLLEKMQKAIAIIQFKLDGALFRARPEWGMTDRDLLGAIDRAAGTVTVEGATYPLVDTRFPTVDWTEPCRLSPGEEACLRQLQRAFTDSPVLWKQMSFVASHGAMSLVRDRCAIFHGCIPVDDAGLPREVVVDGRPYAGKALLDAIEPVVYRAFRKRAPADLDLLYFLWTGPLSPCFGKHKMATFETYFVADKSLQAEHKNPYFKLLHDKAFCGRVLAEFGIDPVRGFIVNGHVPVKLEAGETAVKQSGRAITIDGAFAAAYGDKGFSLVLDAERIYLAQHHHFDSVEAAIAAGADIVPTVSDVQRYDHPRTVGDTELGVAIRSEIAALEELVRAYDDHLLQEEGDRR